MEAIRRADSFVDALAGGRPVAPQDAADAELAALLGSWRDETRWPPATGLITEAEAIAALNAGLGEKRGGPVRDRRTAAITPRRSHRGLSVIGAAAAAVLSIGGFGAVVAGSGPEDPLYGMRTMLFGAPKQVRDDQVALAARTEMQQVQQLISQGDWQQAQAKLVAVSTQVASIGNEQQKQDLLEQFNDLSAKVVERDPAATAPPGIVYTVPPSATELVPAVAPPTSTPSAPPQSDSATSSSETSSEASSEASSASTSPSTESGTSSSTPTSGTESSESAATSSPTSASTSASQQSQQTTTPTSVAPTTSAAPTTTASPVTTAQATTTSVAPRSATSAAPMTTTAPAAAAETAATETTAEAETGAEAETTAVQATEEPTIESEAPAAVTTAEVAPTPVPVGG